MHPPVAYRDRRHGEIHSAASVASRVERQRREPLPSARQRSGRRRARRGQDGASWQGASPGYRPPLIGGHSTSCGVAPSYELHVRPTSDSSIISIPSGKNVKDTLIYTAFPAGQGVLPFQMTIRHAKTRAARSLRGAWTCPDGTVLNLTERSGQGESQAAPGFLRIRSSG